MARKKKEDTPAPGAPAWTATFGDLMNLLLCFFVLLFSMSSVDAGKAEALIESMAQTFSIFDGGGSSFGEGNMISNGADQLTQLEEYFSTMGQTDDGEIEQNVNEAESEGDSENNIGAESGANAKDNNGAETGAEVKDDNGAESGDEYKDNVGPENGGNKLDNTGAIPGTPTATPKPTLTPEKAMLEKNKGESLTIYDEVAELTNKYNLGDYVEIAIDADQYHYITIEIKGHFLFAPGEAELLENAKPIVSKIGDVLKQYSGYKVEVIGHTDGVPQTMAPYYNNYILSTWRALSVASYLAENKNLGWENVHYEGRADLEKIADDNTEEGRKQNRRVEIRLYNKTNSVD